jgi:predicted metalloprotease with PDZ domain
MNPELAMEWLFEHMDDPDIDAPISNAQMEYIMETLGQAINAQKQTTLAQRVETARKSNKCTFTATGREYAPQVWYQCYTCGLIDSEGCCDVCARICHAGHKLSEPVTSTGYVFMAAHILHIYSTVMDTHCTGTDLCSDSSATAAPPRLVNATNKLLYSHWDSCSVRIVLL